MGYFEALTRAMELLAEDSRVLFVGQSVAYGGQRAFKSFEAAPVERRIEEPISEDSTVGACLGLALEGFIPVCFLPRMDFLIIAANQLVNHVDKLGPAFGAKVIFRTAVGAFSPLDPGPQHTQDHSEALKLMLKNTRVVTLDDPEEIIPRYRRELTAPGSVVMIERMSLY